MHYYKLLQATAWCVMSIPVCAQQDSIAPMRDLQRVEVTAERPASFTLKVPMPVTVINRHTIEMMGSRRLDEVLREQTGLAIVSDIGAGNRAVGIQMQGFESGYTMIMIDGQPMIGRNGGNFDLSRISVANIERIEIIKGASSCLFGSEAMAGAINIVTRQQVGQTQGLAALRYGTYRTMDASIEGETPFAGGKGTGFLSANFYRTDGFNVNPYLPKGKTTPPYDSYTFQGRTRYNLSKISTLQLSARYALRKSVNLKDYGVMPTKDALEEGDFNGSAMLNNNFSNGIQLRSQYYFTRYNTDQYIRDVTKDALIQHNNFVQLMHRGEIQGSRDMWKDRIGLTTGLGGTHEVMKDTTLSGGRTMQTLFGYAQAEWKPTDNFGLIAGARYDYHSRFTGRLNPSAGVRYAPAKWITLKAAYGSGYKAPGFKEMYQVFTNIQQGYTVIGAEVFASALQQLQQAGQVSRLLPAAESIRALQPEMSASFNAGFIVTPIADLKLEVNGFYNNIRNLLTTVPVGVKTNGQQIFSWINIAKAYTTGTEVSFNWTPLKGWNISGGYQLLYAVDRGVKDSINAAASPRYKQITDPETNITRSLKQSDYYGLDNRSRHMANLRVFYEYMPWGLGITLRGNYRGKYGFMDSNNNAFIDRYDIFVKGHVLLYASVQKKLMKERLILQVAADNLTGYTDMLMPGQPGRMITMGVTWKFVKEKSI